jgi:hypothetical protein
MTTTIILIIIAGAIEIFASPRLNKTNEGRILLWYGHRKRKYIIIY